MQTKPLLYSPNGQVHKPLTNVKPSRFNDTIENKSYLPNMKHYKM